MGKADEMAYELMEAVRRQGIVPTEWRTVNVYPHTYTQMCNPSECGNYRGIKLLEHLIH